MKEKFYIKINKDFVLDPETGEVINKVNIMTTIDYTNSMIGYDLYNNQKD